MKKPKILNDDLIDLESIKKICNDYINFIGSKEYCDDNDYHQWVFETVIEAVYGKEIWNKIHKRLSK